MSITIKEKSNAKQILYETFVSKMANQYTKPLFKPKVGYLSTPKGAVKVRSSDGMYSLFFLILYRKSVFRFK